MSIFWMFLPVAIACGVLEGKRRGQALREADREAREAAIEEEKAGEGLEASAEVWRVLMPVYTEIRKAGASCRPWIHDCVQAIEAGRVCPAGVAILALLKTGEDLAGSRWDTDKMAEVFGQAAGKLATMS